MKMEAFLQIRGSLLGMIWPGTSAMSRGIFGFHNSRRGVLLSSSGYGSGMSPNILQCIEEPPPPKTKNFLGPNVNCAQVEKNMLKWI